MGKKKCTAALIIVEVCMLVFGSGCHRQHYRKQADCEANFLLDEKASHLSRPPQDALRIDIDRRSRMFNPFDLDFQPMPLDDPSSYEYMQCVDKRRGYPLWQAAGVTNTAESPDWWQYLPLDENGILVLNSENAVRIALLHSPEYQAQLEQLYLAALDVSNQRFQFDTQFFGGAQTFLTADGRRRNGAGNNSSTRFEVGTFSRGQRPLSLERRFATGGELVAGVANNIVWELSGPNTQSANTIFDFTLLQPLLRGAGRDRVLEGLTFSERNLLASVRAFERYRRSFYLNITVGRPVESLVANGNPSTSINGQGFGTGGGSASGFIGLLQTQLQIRNLEENIARQTENLLILEDTLIEQLTTIPDDAETIVRQRLQVAQARSSLLRSQSQLVSQQAGYERTVDAFLRNLGLPPYLCVRIEDPILDRFELIDRDLLGRREQLAKVRIGTGRINVSILENATVQVDEKTGLPESRIEWTDEIASAVQSLNAEIDPLAEFIKTLVDDDLPRVAIDISQFRDSLDERQTQNEQLKKAYQQQKEQICSLLNTSEIDEEIFDITDLTLLSTTLDNQYEKLSKQLETYEKRIEKLSESIDKLSENGPADKNPSLVAKTLRNEIIVASQDLLGDLANDVLALQLIQARARTESVLLPEVNIDVPSALQIARVNRRDWANARADLVDTWRLIAVTANDLESSLDVVFNGDVQNVGNNPLDLRTSTGRLRVGLQWDAPITRLIERNNYRASLIAYEQAKRIYYGFEDSVWQQLRAEVRQLQANRLTFELGRQSVGIAASQIELNADIRELNDARGRSSGPTAARDAISALNDLLDAQNSLLNIFVNYEVVRRSLDMDLGTMELTAEGLWIDPGKIDPDYLLTLSGTSESGMIGGCNDCCLPRRPQPKTPEFGMIINE